MLILSDLAISVWSIYSICIYCNHVWSYFFLLFYWVGQKVHIRSYRNTWMNFLANPVFCFSDSFPLPFFLASNKLKSKCVWHTHLFLLLVWKINTFRLFYLVIVFKKLAGVIDLMKSKCSVPQSMNYRLVPIQELCCTVRFSSRWD